MQPYIPVFQAMALLYISLAAVWARTYVHNWQKAAALQHCLTILVAVGAIQMTIR